MRLLLPLLTGALAVLTLSGCDSGGPDSTDEHPAALVGSWSALQTDVITFVTSPTAQTYIDYSEPELVTGSVTGDAALTFTSGELYVGAGSGFSGRFYSYDRANGRPSSNWAELEVSTQSNYTSYWLEMSLPGTGSAYYSTNGPTSAVVRSGATIRVAPAVFQLYGGGSVTVSARADYPSVALAPDARTRVRTQPAPGFGIWSRHTLSADGAFRSERDSGYGASTFAVGRWAAQDGILRVEAEASAPNGTGVITRYDYQLDGTELSLSVPGQVCLDECLTYTAQAAGLRQPISAAESIVTSVFARTDAPFKRPPSSTD